MRNIKILLTINFFICLSVSCLYSQELLGYNSTNWCGTRVSKEDVDYVAFLKNNIQKSLGTPNGHIYFRVQHHIVRDGNGNNGLSPREIPSIMTYLNRMYSAAGVQFYSCNPVELINSDVYYQLDNDMEELLLRQSYNDPGAINIYYFQPMINGYWAYTYQNGHTNFIALRNEVATNGSTITHEMGHFFGLLHTFHGYSTPVTKNMELVTRGSGRNCETTGDRLCDTQADPFIGNNEVNTNCNYLGNARDYNNTLYTPDVTNFMAYSRPTCRFSFSNGQIGIIELFASSSSKQSFIHKTIVSNNSNFNGSISNDFISVDNSIVISGNSVLLDACYEIEIVNNFEVQLGATFEIF